MKPLFKVYSSRFLKILHSSVIFWQIFTCNMAMEGYRHEDHACFVHIEKFQKVKALEQKRGYFCFFHALLIFTCIMAMERY